MKLDVSTAIRTPGQEYAFCERQAMAAVEVSGETVELDEIEVKGVFQALEDGSVTVEGTLATVAHSCCANCLAPASAEIRNSFRETFIHGGDPDDDEIFVYDGQLVDLDRLVLTYLLLAMPMRFLCREDCEGMAQYVEADSNVCLCRDGEAPRVQHPFAALQQLLDQQSSEEDAPKRS